MTTRLIFVGGFLGAGKTTLLLRAAGMLAEQGQRVGVVMNDQSSNLVDTATRVNTDPRTLEAIVRQTIADSWRAPGAALGSDLSGMLQPTAAAADVPVAAGLTRWTR